MAGRTGEHFGFLLGRAKSDLKKQNKTNKKHSKKKKLAFQKVKSKSKKEKYLLFRKSLFDVPEEETRISVNLDAALLLHLIEAELLIIRLRMTANTCLPFPETPCVDTQKKNYYYFGTSCNYCILKDKVVLEYQAASEPMLSF